QDGSITRAEVPLAAGLKATFRVTSDVGVDTAGTAEADGSRTWKLDGALDGDHDVLITTMPLTGQWFANDFGGASYVARLSQKAELLGVFEITSDELLLRGVVSPKDGVDQTELTYDPPVVVLSFPIGAGGGWKTTSTVTGQLSGVYGIYTE